MRRINQFLKKIREADKDCSDALLYFSDVAAYSLQLTMDLYAKQKVQEALKSINLMSDDEIAEECMNCSGATINRVEYDEEKYDYLIKSRNDIKQQIDKLKQ